MVIDRPEVYIDMINSLYEILEDGASSLPHDVKQLKKSLESNYDEEKIKTFLWVLREDAKETMENLQEIITYTEEIEVDMYEFEEKKREEYTSAFHRMFSLP